MEGIGCRHPSDMLGYLQVKGEVGFSGAEWS